MFELIKVIFDICLFKKGPAALPYSAWLLRLLLAINIGISFLLGNIGTDWFKALLQALVSVILLITLAAIILTVTRKSARFVQTASALLSIDSLISFFAIPGTATIAAGHYNVLVFLTMTGLIVWHWAITGHIIRHSLDKPLAFGLGVAFLYLFSSYQVMTLLFPDVGNLQ